MRKEELLTTCFGLGKLPFCPGTWGSLPPVVLYPVLRYVSGASYPWVIPVVMAALLAVFSWICVRYSPAVIAATGKKDPGMIVADEVAGQAMTMLIISLFWPVNICNAAVRAWPSSPSVCSISSSRGRAGSWKTCPGEQGF